MKKQYIDLIIKNGLIINVGNSHGEEAKTDVIEDSYIAVDKGIILKIGECIDIENEFIAERTIDAEGKAVLPGFVDTHHHLLQHYLKGPRDNVTLPEWIEHVSAPVITQAVRDYKNGNYDLQLYATRFGCLEAIKMGITTILNMEWATHHDILDVYNEVGIRAVHTLTLTDIDEWGNDDMLLPIPEALILADQLIAKTKELSKNRVSFRYGLADEICCSPALIRSVHELANKNQVGIHLHMAETTRTVQKIQEKYGKSPVAYLNSLGLLGPNVLGAHCIWISDEDIEILAKTGTTISHNPEANAKVSEGIAPVAKLIQRGVTVSLGTDTVAANDNMDMFEAMRFAALLQKVTTLDPTVLPAYETLYMGTLGGAKALGMDNIIGSIKVGKKADLILVDIDSIHMQPRNNIINNLVYCASAAANVDTVIIEGEILVEGGQFTKVNEKEEILRFKNFAKSRFTKEGIILPSYY